MEVEENLRNWFPRNIIRRTNWLYRIDALRNHDIREMNLLWEILSLFLEQCEQFVVWTFMIKHLMINASDSIYFVTLKEYIQLLLKFSSCYALKDIIIIWILYQLHITFLPIVPICFPQLLIPKLMILQKTMPLISLDCQSHNCKDSFCSS